jgi:hypothetical protein
MIDQFTKQDFEDYLKTNHSPFRSLGLIDGEETYELSLDDQTSITIRSSIKSNGLSADVASDSIRAWLVSGDKPLGGKTRTYRKPGWENRLNEKLKQLTLWRALAGDCKECNKPKGIFKARTEANKGRPFTRCKEHNGFAWLDEPIKTSDIYFSEESHESDSSEPLGMVAHDKQSRETDIVRKETASDKNDSSIQQHIGTMPEMREEKPSDSITPKSPNPAQQLAIEADINTDLRVLAGPGSGKSKVIEWRYEFLVNNKVHPDNIVVCTFGKPAATEIAERIKKLVPQANSEQICTINALCYRMLAKWDTSSRWYKWGGPKEWQIKKTLDEAIGIVWREKENPGAQEVYNYINTSKYLGLTTDDSYEWFVGTLGSDRGEWLYTIRCKFDAWLNRNSFLTFADQLYLVEKQLQTDEAWRTKWQSRFDQVIVDETQDTNYQAMRILVTLSLEPGQNTVYGNKQC